MLSDLDKWLHYFAHHPDSVASIDWSQADVLTVQEKARISRSMAAFQLGEYSEGKSLLGFAREYAVLADAAKLVQITRHFIREEQNHARMLDKFMALHRIPVLRKNWTDTVFRRLRKNAGYELSITVLITAEILALTYYRALQRATRSPLLKAICERIIEDESAHVEYESGLINYMRSRHSTLRSTLTILGHRFLNAGTLIAVYADHRQVLRGGGYTFRTFWRSCWSDFDKAFHPEQAAGINT